MISNQKGFSLVEILIVVVIIGVLATLAVPKYMSVVRKAKEKEAQLMLNQLHSLQESYYFEKDVYAQTLADLEFEQEKLVTEGGKARFVIKIESADNVSYKATASSIVDFDKDGVFSVWEVTQEGIINHTVND